MPKRDSSDEVSVTDVTEVIPAFMSGVWKSTLCPRMSSTAFETFCSIVWMSVEDALLWFTRLPEAETKFARNNVDEPSRRASAQCDRSRRRPTSQDRNKVSRPA